MPQDGSNNYYYPPGTPGIPDQTIESESYNTFLDDLVNNDLNIPRPIHRGGTGANTAEAAMAALGGEKSSQLVSNFDSHVWIPGSFYSLASATGSPINGSAFAGWVYSSDPAQTPPLNQNIVVHAYDLSAMPRPGKLYTKEKRAGVWSAWVVETNISTGPTPPTGMRDGSLYWDSDNGVLYVLYNDGNSTQWVQAVALPAIDTTAFVQRAGDSMTGPLTLPNDPTADLHAATKRYADASGVAGASGKVSKSGDVMTGFLTLSDNPTAVLHAATKQYVDGGVAGIPGKVSKAGDTMTGALTLPSDPTAALHAATKQYVDAKLIQKVSIEGGKQFDIQVPVGAQAVRVTGVIIPTSATIINPHFQLSLVNGIFITATIEHSSNGFVHATSSNNQNTIPITNSPTAGFVISNSHSNAVASLLFDGTIMLKRPNATTLFCAEFRASQFNPGGMVHSFIYDYLQATAGNQLSVLALRLVSSTGDNWAAGSFVTMEWM